VHFHCLPHKQMLRVKEMLKQSEDIDDLVKFLYTLCRYFRGSAKRVELLSEKEEITEEGDDLKLVVPFEVRWLSIFPAIERVLQLFTSCYEALKELSNNEKAAKDLFEKLQKFETIATFVMLADLLEPINFLVTIRQTNSLSIDLVAFEYKAVNNKLKNYSTGLMVGKRLEAFLSGLKYISHKTSKHKDCKLEHKSYFDESLNLIKEKFKQLSSRLLTSVEGWFGNYPILNNFATLDVNLIREQPETALNSYGKIEISSLIKTFNQNFRKFNEIPKNPSIELLEETEILKQYQEFKFLIYNDADYRKLNREQVYSQILKSPSYKQLSRLLEIYLVLPITSVECERVFSQINIIKHRLRASLETETLDSLLNIKLNGDKVEDYDFRDSFILWKTSAKRYFI